MGLILLCSVVGIGVAIERFWSLRRSKVIPPDFIGDVKQLIVSRKYLAAKDLCDQSQTSISRIYLAGIEVIGRPREALVEVVQEAARAETAELEKYLGVLATIVGLAPLIGLLGTVLGMINAFNVISYQGVGNPGLLSGGISQALISTAAGLSVAIPALTLHRYLTSRADRLTIQLERECFKLIETLSAGHK